MKKRIRQITYEGDGNIPFDLIIPYLTLRGGVLDASKIPTDVEIIKDRLVQKGYRGVSIESEVVGDEYFVALKFKILYKAVVKVSNIDVEVDYDSRRSDIYRAFKRFKNKVWDKIDTKVVIDKLTENFFREGFYFSRVVMGVEDVDNKTVKLKVNISLDKRFNFVF